MYKKFEVLSEEKQIRIINAAFNEFAYKQFKEASTDEIAMNAGISKGALFQYFGTKKQLYSYIYNYGYKILETEIYGQMNFLNPDLIDCLKEILSIKMRLYFKYPMLFDFILFSHTKENDVNVKALINSDVDIQNTEIYKKIYSNIDYSKFKIGLDAKHVVSIITWTVEGYSNSVLTKLKQESLSNEKYIQCFEEFESYMKTLKKAFYKEVKQHGKRN
ncbi:MAG: TetR/AcrR family transcriptional regulator [Eubacteriales bacterium]